MVSCGYSEKPPRGEVAEWSKAQHWKCCIGATLSRVRIPPSPFQKAVRKGGFFVLTLKRESVVIDLPICACCRAVLNSGLSLIPGTPLFACAGRATQPNRPET